jgi:uncharacterized protein
VTLLVDSNVWIAAQDRQNRDHGPCSALLLDHAGSLVATVPVIIETAWFIEDRHGPARESEFLQLVTSGTVKAIDLTTDDWRRCVELVDRYTTLGLGVVDASVIAVAERLELTSIATMNGRDFYAVRPKHCPAFTLLPEGLATE